MGIHCGIWLLILSLGSVGCSRKKQEQGTDLSKAGKGPNISGSAQATSPKSTEQVASPAPSSQPVADAESTIELYGWKGVPSAIAAQKGVPAALSSKLLHTLFPEYLANRERCPEDPGTLEQARMRGFIVPSIESTQVGSFSRAGISEQLFTVSVGECGATHAEGWGSNRLVVWSDGKVTQNIQLSGALSGAVDLDGDGRAEILIEGGGANQGITIVNLIVARLDLHGISTIANLGIVHEESCGSLQPEGVEVSLVTAVRRGGKVDFDLRKEKRPCK